MNRLGTRCAKMVAAHCRPNLAEQRQHMLGKLIEHFAERPARHLGVERNMRTALVALLLEKLDQRAASCDDATAGAEWGSGVFVQVEKRTIAVWLERGLPDGRVPLCDHLNHAAAIPLEIGR